MDRLGSMLTPKQDDEMEDFSARLNNYSKKKTIGEREKIIYKKQEPSNWQKFKKQMKNINTKKQGVEVTKTKTSTIQKMIKSLGYDP